MARDRRRLLGSRPGNILVFFVFFFLTFLAFGYHVCALRASETNRDKPGALYCASSIAILKPFIEYRWF